MEIRQLEYFRKIALTGSINEAARQLNMSQPPLSYQLKLLEEELDVVLFERSRQGVTMTEAGKLLYQRSEELLPICGLHQAGGQQDRQASGSAPGHDLHHRRSHSANNFRLRAKAPGGDL